MLTFHDLEQLSTLERNQLKDRVEKDLRGLESSVADANFAQMLGDEGANLSYSQAAQRLRLVDKVKECYQKELDSKGGVEPVLDTLTDYLVEKIGDQNASKRRKQRAFKFEDSPKLRTYKTALRAVLDPNPESPFGYFLHPDAPSMAAGGRSFIHLREILAYYWVAACDKEMPLDEKNENDREHCIEAEKHNVVERLKDLRREYSRVSLDAGENLEEESETRLVTVKQVEDLKPEELEQLSESQLKLAKIDKASCPSGQFSNVTGMGLYNLNTSLDQDNPVLTADKELKAFFLQQFNLLSLNAKVDVYQSYLKIITDGFEFPAELKDIKEFVSSMVQNQTEDVYCAFPNFLIAQLQQQRALFEYFEKSYGVDLSPDEKDYLNILLIENVELFINRAPHTFFEALTSVTLRDISDSIVEDVFNETISKSSDELFVGLNTIYTDIFETYENLEEMSFRDIMDFEDLRECSEQQQESITNFVNLINQKNNVLANLKDGLKQQALAKAEMVYSEQFDEILMGSLKAKLGERLETKLSTAELKKQPFMHKILMDFENIEGTLNVILGNMVNLRNDFLTQEVHLAVVDYIRKDEDASLEPVKEALNNLKTALIKYNYYTKLDSPHSYTEDKKNQLLENVNICANVLNQSWNTVIHRACELLESEVNVEIDDGIKNTVFNELLSNLSREFSDSRAIVGFVEDCEQKIKEVINVDDINDVYVDLLDTSVESLNLYDAYRDELSVQQQKDFIESLNLIHKNSPKFFNELLSSFTAAEKSSIRGYLARVDVSYPELNMALLSINPEKDGKKEGASVSKKSSSLGQSAELILSGMNLRLSSDSVVLSFEQIENAQNYLNSNKSSPELFDEPIRGYISAKRFAEVQSPKKGGDRVVILFRSLANQTVEAQADVPITLVSKFAKQSEQLELESEIFSKEIDTILTKRFKELNSVPGLSGKKLREEYLSSLIDLMENNDSLLDILLKGQTLDELKNIRQSLKDSKNIDKDQANQLYKITELTTAYIKKTFETISNHKNMDMAYWDKDRAELYLEKARNILRVDPLANEKIKSRKNKS